MCKCAVCFACLGVAGLYVHMSVAISVDLSVTLMISVSCGLCPSYQCQEPCLMSSEGQSCFLAVVACVWLGIKLRLLQALTTI
jgi:hypothetical protein